MIPYIALEVCVFNTFRQVLHDNWEWRKQSWNLAKIDLVKTYRGAALGWIWLFVKPAVYIGVYYFTFAVGMRSAAPVNGMPYLLWMACGVFPWFFMSDMISTGSDVYNKYPFLVNRIRFPLSVISTFYAMSKLIVFMGTMAFTIALCLITGVKLSIYLLQLPLIFILMLYFWIMWSIWLSPLSAISKDFANLVKTLQTPFFWLSGVLFRLQKLPHALRVLMYFNPVSWACEVTRHSFVDFAWIWEYPKELGVYLAMCLLVTILAMHSYKRLHKEVPDVL